MTVSVSHSIALPEGFRSREAGLFVAQLNDQNRRLTIDTRGITPAELEWQPAPGMNTIGMLLAHLAIVEVWWNGLIFLEVEKPDIDGILGIGVDDDGMPVAEDGLPPRTLAGKSMEFYDDLLARARAHLTATARGLDDAAIERTVTRTRQDGSLRSVTGRWTLYHILEHLAGHYGQILLLRHQYRVAQAAAERGTTVR
jgi:uncharacterized damage-inducible protein DinB